MAKHDHIVDKLDSFQKEHKSASFVVAVFKKYSQDNGGYQAAILSYYGFLSLFPLMLVFTTVTEFFVRSNGPLRQRISTSIIHYFPIVGEEIQKSIHSPKKSGIELVISLLVLIYAARGGANALQFTFNHLWNRRIGKQPDFIKATFRSLGIIGIGGLGLILASILSSYTAILGNLFIIKILATLLSFMILWVMFVVVFKLALAGDRPVSDIKYGAASAAVGVQILQSLGTAILAHELRQLNNYYGTFALAIGLMFWIYLQAEVILYCVEIDTVRLFHLYPKSLRGDQNTIIR